RDYPPFNKSLMDGFAVRAADVARTPAELRVVDRLAAGRVATVHVGPGEATAIMTGAPMPDGAEGVVPVEDTQEQAERVRILRADAIGRNVAVKGRDCAAGKTVIPRVTVLGPAQVAVAARAGRRDADVLGHARVA